MREPNQGEAAWRLDAGRFVVLYDHPHAMDIDAVRIVTVWTKRRRPRHLHVVKGDAGRYPEP